MRNKSIFLYILVIILFICGCAETVDPSQTNSVQQNTFSGGTSFNGDTDLLFFNSLDNLDIYLQKYGPEEGFVSYDQIRNLGEFRSLVFIATPMGTPDECYVTDYSRYLYTLVDANGTRIDLRVHTPDDALSSRDIILAQDVTHTDMRKLSSEKTGTYSCNGVEYAYCQGDLYCVSWIYDGKLFSIECYDVWLSEHPLNSDSILSGLLKTETAPNAIASIFTDNQ